MGTPQIAVASLKALLNAGFNVVGVVTTPDKPAGRGKQLHQSDVKTFALEYNLPILQPANLKSPDFIEALTNLKPDLQIVVAFRMLPKVVWNLPPLGTFNMHASLLPDYRGAAPINHAIINGESESGVTTFLLNEHMDEGEILYRESIALSPVETAGSLHDKLMDIGAKLVVKTTHDLLTGTIKPQPQTVEPSELLHPAPKIFKHNCEINWQNDAVTIERLIRGLSPYPTAFSRLSEDLSVKLFDVEFAHSIKELGKPAEIRTDGKSHVYVCCSDGQWLSLKSIQLSGKKRLSVEDLLKGFNVSKFSHFLPPTP
ncbi:MAG: methionyl-tRNA formyltransferase [Bacteroidales bacterium]|jgi:methionyl-tRNA formyltransferase|nr:methionyl-tRNA formyltransferase [Bacteroidales bacterium]